eukprot:jgi/Ulvmu1/9042/UM005_0135.1
MFERISGTAVIAGAAVLRMILIVYGIWQDAHASVRYTDIDYDVFTDAAKFVHEGGSPYERATFRYTPLLAYLMLPNISVHIAFGKVLFAAADIAVALLVQQMVMQTCAYTKVSPLKTQRLVQIALLAWLFNPYTATISTRGNGDSLVVLMQLGVLKLLRTSHIVSGVPIGAISVASATAGQGALCLALAGGVYGLLVHWRVFPVIYGPSLMLYLWTITTRAPHRLATWVKHCLVFGVPAMAVFCGLGVYFYHLYGHQFLHESFLYHAGRQDPRHNFSPHFLFTYLYHFAPRDAAGLPMRPDLPFWLNPGATAPWCMASALLATAWAFREDLDMSWLLCTIVFVALNKVSTAQYYVWFLGIFPVVLPSLHAGWGRLQWAAVASFVTCQLLWLSQAYRLEFLGEPVFRLVWGIGLALMASQVLLYCALVQASVTARKVKAA